MRVTHWRRARGSMISPSVARRAEAVSSKGDLILDPTASRLQNSGDSAIVAIIRRTSPWVVR